MCLFFIFRDNIQAASSGILEFLRNQETFKDQTDINSILHSADSMTQILIKKITFLLWTQLKQGLCQSVDSIKVTGAYLGF